MRSTAVAPRSGMRRPAGNRDEMVFDRRRKSRGAGAAVEIRGAVSEIDYRLLRKTIACPVRSTIGNSGLSAKNSSTALRAPGQEGNP